MANIFDTADGGTISGVFGGSDEDTIVFSTVGGAGSSLDGFIIESYNVSWARPVMTRRAYNKKGSIITMGKGTGSLTLSGLVGPSDEFEALLDATSGNNVCKNANCVIRTGGGYSACDSNGNKSSSSNPVTITAKGIILQSLSLGGQLQEGAVSLTNANMVFKVSGLSVG